MTFEKDTHSTEYKKKVFTKMYQSSMRALEAEKNRPHKKISASSKQCGLREQFKQSFLPLLIELFELKQMAANHKTNPLENPLLHLQKRGKSPTEILERLKQMQSDIEETKRWCEGIIRQISKGTEEIREMIENVDKSTKFQHSVTTDSQEKPVQKSLLWLRKPWKILLTKLLKKVTVHDKHTS